MSSISSTQDLALRDTCPIGTIIAFPATAIPNGWLECNGQAVSRVTFAELFALIDTAYGAGDGTTFNLPDYRGVFLRGKDNGKGYDVGRTLGSEQADAFQGHTHGNGTLGISTRSNYSSGSNEGVSVVAGTALTIMTDGTNGTPRTATETRPKNVSVVYCIKATMAITTSLSTVSTYAAITHTTHYGEAASFGTNGYKRFADGLILQWGTAVLNTATSATITFPVAFPSGCLCVVGSLGASGAWSVVSCDTYTQTNFRLVISAGNATLQVVWQAIGR